MYPYIDLYLHVVNIVTVCTSIPTLARSPVPQQHTNLEGRVVEV